MSGISVRALLATKPGDNPVITQGWIRTKRESKNVVFFEINDGSCFSSLQAVLNKEETPLDEELNRCLLAGASVEIQGRWVVSQGKNQGLELQVERVTVLGKVASDYPLQKKRHSFEFLREIAHLRPRTRTFNALTRVRNAVSMAVHDFFQKRSYLWIHTPIITGNDAEGAGNMFQVSTLEAGNPPRTEAGEIDYSQDFFATKAYLTVSGQLQLENYASAMSNVYSFGPTFRAENSNTTRHLGEFWMIEPETAFCDLEANQCLAKDLIQYLLKEIFERCPEEMDFFDQWIEKGNSAMLRKVMQAPFLHLDYGEAIKELKKAKKDWSFPPSWGIDLQTEHERYLTEIVACGPVIVSNYPKEGKAFYMKQNDDEKTVRAMDVLVPRLGEIIGGSQREDDYARLDAGIRNLGMEPENYSWYLDLRRYGSVPHSGFGLGLERLLQYITGMANIKDVIAFPRAAKTLDF